MPVDDDPTDDTLTTLVTSVVPAAGKLVVGEEGNLKGLITVKDIQKKEKFPNATKDMHGRVIVAAAIGTDSDVMDRVDALVDSYVDALVLDTAHGHSQGVLDVVNKIKTKHPNIDLIAGNVATAEGTQALVDNGADIIKIGIGAGSSCTTRIVAGVGIPQLTSVLECSGGIFAGTDESPGEVALWEGRSYKVYRGMGSVAAMKSGSSDRYFQNSSDVKKLVPEGVEGLVPYKGLLGETVHQLVGGVKSCLGYCGSKNIQEFQKNAEFVRITSAGSIESHPHDMNITKDSPNYRNTNLK